MTVDRKKRKARRGRKLGEYREGITGWVNAALKQRESYSYVEVSDLIRIRITVLCRNCPQEAALIRESAPTVQEILDAQAPVPVANVN